MKVQLSEKQGQLNHWNGELWKEKEKVEGLDIDYKILRCIFIVGAIIFFTLNIFQFGIYLDMNNITIMSQIVLSSLIGFMFGCILCLLFIGVSALLYSIMNFETDDTYFFFFPKERVRLEKLENDDFSDYPVLQDLWEKKQSLQEEINDLKDLIMEKENYLSGLANTWISRCSDEEVKDFILYKMQSGKVD